MVSHLRTIFQQCYGQNAIMPCHESSRWAGCGKSASPVRRGAYGQRHKSTLPLPCCFHLFHAASSFRSHSVFQLHASWDAYRFQSTAFISLPAHIHLAGGERSESQTPITFPRGKRMPIGDNDQGRFNVKQSQTCCKLSLPFPHFQYWAKLNHTGV